MAIENTLLIVDIVAVMLALVSMIYISRLREFEVRDVESSMNAIMFGVFFLLIILIVNTIQRIDKVFHDRIASFIPEITTYISYLTQISELALAPLLAACFLIGIFLLRENA